MAIIRSLDGRTRRCANRLAAVIGVLTFACTPAHAVTNVVLFIADDLGWNDVGYHGSEIRTPTIDRLAAEGVILDRFYAHPVCSPTRSALMTGRSPLRTGVLIPFEPWFSTGLPLSEKLLPEYFGDAGYRTLAVGKWHLGPHHVLHHPQSRGFDHFYGHLGGFINHEMHTIWRGVDWQRNRSTVYEEGYATDLIADEAVRLVQEHDTEVPLFLYVAFNAPHSPLQAPADAIAEYDDIGDFDRRIFAAMVTELDRAIARVLAALDDAGLSDDTLVMFMSDNGGEETLGADNGPFRDMKGTPWEGGIRVPALLWLPGVLEAGSRYGGRVAVEDLLPTFMAAAEIEAEWPQPLDGMNLWPALTSGSTIEDRSIALARHNHEQYSIAYFSGDWKLVQTPGETPDAPRYALFRILEDPSEQNDLAAEQPDILERLIGELAALPRGPVVGMDDPPIPTATGLGGPMSIPPDRRPPNREPWAESARTD